MNRNWASIYIISSTLIKSFKFHYILIDCNVACPKLVLANLHIETVCTLKWIFVCTCGSMCLYLSARKTRLFFFSYFFFLLHFSFSHQSQSTLEGSFIIALGSCTPSNAKHSEIYFKHKCSCTPPTPMYSCVAERDIN